MRQYRCLELFCQIKPLLSGASFGAWGWRDQMVSSRTRLICQMRGFCLEYGVPIHQGAGVFKLDLPRVIADKANDLTSTMRRLLDEQLGKLKRRNVIGLLPNLGPRITIRNCRWSEGSEGARPITESNARSQNVN
jgi:hypothetical protein